jgi:hypothetical protein
MQPAASLSHAVKARIAAEQRAAEAKGEQLRASEAANLRRFGENVRDLRAFGQAGRWELATAPDGAPALLIKFRDEATAKAADAAIYGASGE